MKIKEQRTARVADVRRVYRATSQSPQQERINRPEQHVAPLGAQAKAWDGLEQVADLCAGKVRVEHETGPGPEHRLQALGLQAFADRRRDSALPHDRVRHRSTGMPVPEHRRLALIGDTDRGQVVCRQPRTSDGLARDCQLRRPDGLRIVLDVPGWKKYLGEFLLCGGSNASVSSKYDRSTGGRALVQGKDVLTHEELQESDLIPRFRWGCPERVEGPGSPAVSGLSLLDARTALRPEACVT